VPRAALDKALKTEPAPLDHSMYFKRLAGIFRAARSKSAALPYKRTNAELIDADEQQQNKFHACILPFFAGNYQEIRIVLKEREQS